MILFPFCSFHISNHPSWVQWIFSCVCLSVFSTLHSIQSEGRIRFECSNCSAVSHKWNVLTIQFCSSPVHCPVYSYSVRQLFDSDNRYDYYHLIKIKVFLCGNTEPESFQVERKTTSIRNLLIKSNSKIIFIETVLGNGGQLFNTKYKMSFTKTQIIKWFLRGAQKMHENDLLETSVSS